MLRTWLWTGRMTGVWRRLLTASTLCALLIVVLPGGVDSARSLRVRLHPVSGAMGRMAAEHRELDVVRSLRPEREAWHHESRCRGRGASLFDVRGLRLLQSCRSALRALTNAFHTLHRRLPAIVALPRVSNT